jgi:site-specific DNA-adenine methylase
MIFCGHRHKYKINNNNKTNTKDEFNVKYGRYQQDISKDTLQMQKKVKKLTFFRKHVSLSCLHFSLMFSEGEVKSPYFLQVILDLFIFALKFVNDI